MLQTSKRPFLLYNKRSVKTFATVIPRSFTLGLSHLPAVIPSQFCYLHCTISWKTTTVPVPQQTYNRSHLIMSGYWHVGSARACSEFFQQCMLRLTNTPLTASSDTRFKVPKGKHLPWVDHQNCHTLVLVYLYTHSSGHRCIHAKHKTQNKHHPVLLYSNPNP